MKKSTEDRLFEARDTWAAKFMDASKAAGVPITHAEAYRRADVHCRRVARDLENK